MRLAPALESAPRTLRAAVGAPERQLDAQQRQHAGVELEEEAVDALAASRAKSSMPRKHCAPTSSSSCLIAG
jgi:hypothetical protein